MHFYCIFSCFSRILIAALSWDRRTCIAKNSTKRTTNKPHVRTRSEGAENWTLPKIEHLAIPVTTAFLFAGRWCTTTGGSISGNSYLSQNENMSGLESACSNPIRQRKCCVFVSVFPCAIAHCVRIPMLNMFVSDGLSPTSGLCLLAQSLWRESNVLDNWQLTILPLFELCEFNPRWVRDNLSASLWVIGRFPQQRKTTRIFMYVCVRACMCTCIYACLSPCTSRMRLLWYCPIFTVRRITSHTNILYAKTHFTIKGNI